MTTQLLVQIARIDDAFRKYIQEHGPVAVMLGLDGDGWCLSVHTVDKPFAVRGEHIIDGMAQVAQVLESGDDEPEPFGSAGAKDMAGGL